MRNFIWCLSVLKSDSTCRLREVVIRRKFFLIAFMNVNIFIYARFLNVKISFELFFTMQWIKHPYYDRIRVQIYTPPYSQTDDLLCYRFFCQSAENQVFWMHNSTFWGDHSWYKYPCKRGYNQTFKQQIVYNV